MQPSVSAPPLLVLLHREDTFLMASSLPGHFTPTIPSEWPGNKHHFLLEAWGHWTAWFSQVQRPVLVQKGKKTVLYSAHYPLPLKNE